MGLVLNISSKDGTSACGESNDVKIFDVESEFNGTVEDLTCSGRVPGKQVQQKVLSKAVFKDKDGNFVHIKGNNKICPIDSEKTCE